MILLIISDTHYPEFRLVTDLQSKLECSVVVLKTYNCFVPIGILDASQIHNLIR